MKRPQIENVHFWNFSQDGLEFTIKDCHEAMASIPDNPKNISGPNNYADQINDACTVLSFKKMRREKVLNDILKTRKQTS